MSMHIDGIAAALGGPAAGGARAAHGRAGETFDAVLNDALREVQRGDTLSDIVANRQRALGIEVSTAGIYDGVARVATANGLRDPDLIHVGEKIDLSSLNGPRVIAARATDFLNPPAIAKDLSLGANPDAAAIAGERVPPGDTNAVWRAIVDGPARVTSEFGLRADPFTGESKRHGGVDLAAARGTTVYPVAPGEVVFSDWMSGYGNVVKVAHGDGLETLYGHQDENLVRVGDRVSSTTPLGTVGETGRATAPHLHFEVRRDGEALDPVPYVTGLMSLRGVDAAGP